MFRLNGIWSAEKTHAVTFDTRCIYICRLFYSLAPFFVPPQNSDDGYICRGKKGLPNVSVFTRLSGQIHAEGNDLANLSKYLQRGAFWR